MSVGVSSKKGNDFGENRPASDGVLWHVHLGRNAVSCMVIDRVLVDPEHAGSREALEQLLLDLQRGRGGAV